LRSWISPGSTLIDIMMNVSIILRAAQYSGDDELWHVAVTHSRTTKRYLMRGDGSTCHEGWFDTETGEFVRCGTHQGWRSDSSWARGQAWAIYGFSEVYRYTRDVDFLDAAMRAADYYIRSTGYGGVPPNDWREPSPRFHREASAAAIAAAGLLRLSRQIENEMTRAYYRNYAYSILHTLRSVEYLAIDVPGWEGILRHTIYHHRHGLGVDESTMFGDYYLMEALELASSEDLKMI
jgi:unsaturated chondroitin disaccharide hydrolase